MKPKLAVGPVWTHVFGCVPKINAALNALEADFQGYGVRNWKGTAFMSGLVPRLKDLEDVDVLDHRIKAPLVSGALPAWLRDYQAVAVTTALFKGQGVIKAPTAAGKTAIGAGLIAMTTCPWTYFVPAPSLAKQTAAWLRDKLKEPVGELHGGCKKIEGRVLVATYDAMFNSKPGFKFLETCKGIIADEVHKAATNTGMACLLCATNTFFRVGLSATPFDRTDKRNAVVEGLLGPLIYEISPQTLDAAGHTTPLRFVWVPVEQTGPRIRNWQEDYDDKIVRSAARNTAGLAVIVALPKPCFVFVKKIEHAYEMFVSLIKIYNRKVALITGSDTLETRTELIQLVKKGEVEVVVSTKVFSEGVDIPEIASVFPMGGGQSTIEAIQTPGRGRRLSKGKEVCYVADFADSGTDWLLRHTLARYNAYKNAGFEVDPPFPEDVETPSKLGTVFWILLGLSVAVTVGLRMCG